MEKTAVDYLIEILEAPCRGIPTFVIEKAKEIYKQQLLDACVKVFLKMLPV